MNAHIGKALLRLPALIGSIDAATAPHGFSALSGSPTSEVMRKGAKLKGFNAESFSLLADALSATAAVVQLSGGIHFDGLQGLAAKEMHSSCNTAQQACHKHWQEANTGGDSVSACGNSVSQVADRTEETLTSLLDSAEAFFKLALPLCVLPGAGKAAASLVYGVAKTMLDCLGGVVEAQNTCAQSAFAQCEADLATCTSTPVPECPAPAPANSDDRLSKGEECSGSTMPAVATGNNQATACADGAADVAVGDDGVDTEIKSEAECISGKTHASAVAGSLNVAAHASLHAGAAVAGTVAGFVDIAANVAGGMLNLDLPVACEGRVHIDISAECVEKPIQPVVECAPSEQQTPSEPAAEAEPVKECEPVNDADPELAAEPGLNPEMPGEKEVALDQVAEPEPPAEKVKHYNAEMVAGAQDNEPTPGPGESTPAAAPLMPDTPQATEPITVSSAGEW